MHDEQYEAVLGVKETLRQFRQFVDECGDEAADDLLSGGITTHHIGIGSGKEISGGQVCELTSTFGSAVFDTGHETFSEDQPLTVQLLATNAQSRADAGLSKEQWISEVLNGHADDDEAQIGCLIRIAELWKNGPWPWPRSSTWKEKAVTAAC